MKSKNILIVENKEQERKLFEYLIGQLHPCASVDTGEDALNYIAQKPVRLVLLSLQLADLEPANFLKNTKKLCGESCMLVGLTSNLHQVNVPFYYSLGFEEVLSKPIRPKEFILKIQSLLERQEKEKIKNPIVPESLPILNVEVYQQLLRLSTQEVIRQVYVDFIQECVSLSELLDPNPKELPSEEIIRAIHTIKGNSGTLGAEKIHVAAKSSESAARQQKSIDFAESVHYLKVAFSEFQEYLNKYPNEYGA